MDKSRRKDAVREYRERRTRQGIVALRCSSSGACWIAMSRNLEQQKNGLLFQLRMGNHPNVGLQAAWNAQGAENFQFEIIEEIENENPLLIGSLLKERFQFWLEKLAAEKLVG